MNLKCIQILSPRRIMATCLASAVFLASTGLVFVPSALTNVPHSAIAGDEWFPCQDHHCGCTSAEMCRTSCCCDRSSEPDENTSCCSAEKPDCDSDNADADEAALPDGLIIKSRECAGAAAMFAFKAMSWVIPLTQNFRLEQTGPSTILAVNDATPDSAPLPFDPPPPRST